MFPHTQVEALGTGHPQPPSLRQELEAHGVMGLHGVMFRNLDWVPDYVSSNPSSSTYLPDDLALQIAFHCVPQFSHLSNGSPTSNSLRELL